MEPVYTLQQIDLQNTLLLDVSVHTVVNNQFLKVPIQFCLSNIRTHRHRHSNPFAHHPTVRVGCVLAALFIPLMPVLFLLAAQSSIMHNTNEFFEGLEYIFSGLCRCLEHFHSVFLTKLLSLFLGNFSIGF